MENFNALGLPKQLLLALEKMKFTTPTPIQAQAIPPALQGRDVMGTAQTGTGKTAAFVIPMLAHLMKSHSNSMSIVMTPTRELAQQVHAAMREMGANANIRSAILIGGQSMHAQLQQLRQKARVIVGTPGRINDHLEQGSLNLSACDFLVLDETDRMLDMGFGPQIDRIVKKMPKVRQTLMFSATMPDHIVKVSQQYLHQPVRVSVGAINQPIKAIKQELIRLEIPQKYETLIRELRAREGSVIVFVKTKRGADRIAEKLNKDGFHSAAIHGNLNQNQRNRVIQAFRDMKHRIMVATDVAARGLDIPHIEHVINYDLPQVAEDYIHRIGRTARAGKDGAAAVFITPQDADLWREIHKLLNPGEKLPPREATTRTPASHATHEDKYKRKRNRSGFEHRKGGRPEGKSGGGFERKERSFGERKERSFGGERKERDFGGEKRERSFEPKREREFEPRREGGGAFGGRRDEKSRAFVPRSKGGDRPEKRDDNRSEPRGERRERSFGDRPQRGDRPQSGERRERSFGGERSNNDGRKPFGKKFAGKSGMKRGKKY